MTDLTTAYKNAHRISHSRSQKKKDYSDHSDHSPHSGHFDHLDHSEWSLWSLWSRWLPWPLWWHWSLWSHSDHSNHADHSDFSDKLSSRSSSLLTLFCSLFVGAVLFAIAVFVARLCMDTHTHHCTVITKRDRFYQREESLKNPLESAFDRFFFSWSHQDIDLMNT